MKRKTEGRENRIFQAVEMASDIFNRNYDSNRSNSDKDTPTIYE